MSDMCINANTTSAPAWGHDDWVLALDTATPAMTVALLRGRQLVAEAMIRSERNHSINLAPTIRDLLAGQGVAAKQLGGIAVGIGPGSYTGVRIGVTMAKTMAWSLAVPVVGVSSLAALAWRGLELAAVEAEARPGSGDVWCVPLMDARRGQAYTALYIAGSGARGLQGSDDSAALAEAWQTAASPDAIRLLAPWLDELAARAEAAAAEGVAPAAIALMGVTAPFADAIAGLSARLSSVTRVIAADGDLAAADVGRLAWPAAQLGRTTPAHDLQPNYTQQTEAEVKWQAAREGAKAHG